MQYLLSVLTSPEIRFSQGITYPALAQIKKMLLLDKLKDELTGDFFHLVTAANVFAQALIIFAYTSLFSLNFIKYFCCYNSMSLCDVKTPQALNDLLSLCMNVFSCLNFKFYCGPSCINFAL